MSGSTPHSPGPPALGGETRGEDNRPPNPRGPGLSSALQGLRAVLLDMDGTLIDSTYDWEEIRRRLGVDGPSIIDSLNGLPDGARETRWRELEAIEREASGRATLHEGARELLETFRNAGLATALVTNNSEANTRRLLDRFGLRLDLVLTRDSGFYKPSGAPFTEAARRLGVRPEACLVVGDSRYDLEAAREAGVGRFYLLHTTDPLLIERADLHFPGIRELLRFLRSRQ